MKDNLYRHFAAYVDARKTCIERNNLHWRDAHTDAVKKMVLHYMPRGSGLDDGTTIDLERSNGERLVFNTSFHHMNDVGYYDGWTDHTIVVTPSLQFKFVMRITGPNRNDIKDYLYEIFREALMQDIDTVALDKLGTAA